jgi:opacity protein-like surface antigen
MCRSAFALRLALLTTSALFLASPPLLAQGTTTTPSTYPIAFGVGAGLLIPTGDIGNLQSTGWNLQGFADWQSRATPFALRGEITFGSLTGKNIPSPAGTVSASNLHLFTATANGMWLFHPSAASLSRTTPYVLAGVGLYHTSGSSTSPLGTSEDLGSTNFGINFGGGIIYRLAGFSTYAEARFHNVFSGTQGANGKTSAHYFPIVVGLRFGGR